MLTGPRRSPPTPRSGALQHLHRSPPGRLPAAPASRRARRTGRRAAGQAAPTTAADAEQVRARLAAVTGTTTATTDAIAAAPDTEATARRPTTATAWVPIGPPMTLALPTELVGVPAATGGAAVAAGDGDRGGAGRDRSGGGGGGQPAALTRPAGDPIGDRRRPSSRPVRPASYRRAEGPDQRAGAVLAAIDEYAETRPDAPRGRRGPAGGRPRDGRRAGSTTDRGPPRGKPRSFTTSWPNYSPTARSVRRRSTR